MTWEEIQADEVQAGDYIDVNGVHSQIVEANQFRVSYEAAGVVSCIDLQVAVCLGVKFAREVEEHPHGVIPDEAGAVIRTLTGAVYRNDGDRGWHSAGSNRAMSAEEVQGLADFYSFEVLRPRPEVEITDEMSERAGRALWESYRDPLSSDKAQWAEQPESVKNDAIMRATLALASALGDLVNHE